MTSIYSQILDQSMVQPKIINSFKIGNQTDDSAENLSGDNETAFQNIWDRFNLPVRKFIYDLCGNYELTEELAQETFMRVFKGISGFRQETKFSTWVFGIAKNVVFENLRQIKKSDRHVEIEQAELYVLPEEKSSPELAVLEAEMLTAVYKALDKFDEGQRTSFVLRVFHHKSYSEIAEITGYGVSKIKIDIHRVRIKLRKQLSSYIETNDEL